MDAPEPANARSRSGLPSTRTAIHVCPFKISVASTVSLDARSGHSVGGLSGGVEAAEANLRPDSNPHAINSPDELAWRLGLLAVALRLLQLTTTHDGEMNTNQD